LAGSVGAPTVGTRGQPGPNTQTMRRPGAWNPQRLQIPRWIGRWGGQGLPSTGAGHQPQRFDKVHLCFRALLMECASDCSPNAHRGHGVANSETLHFRRGRMSEPRSDRTAHSASNPICITMQRSQRSPHPSSTAMIPAFSQSGHVLTVGLRECNQAIRPRRQQTLAERPQVGREPDSRGGRTQRTCKRHPPSHRPKEG